MSRKRLIRRLIFFPRMYKGEDSRIAAFIVSLSSALLVESTVGCIGSPVLGDLLSLRIL